MAEPKGDEGQVTHPPLRTGPGKRNPATTAPPAATPAPTTAAEPTASPSAEPSGSSAPSGEPTSEPTPSAPATAPVESFFDFERIKDNPELVALHKDMQGAFTKKTQAIAADKSAIDAYKLFQTDPHGTVAKIAKQLGYKELVPISAGPAAPAAGGNGQVDLENFTPANWGEVVTTIGQKLMGQVMEQVNAKYEPILQSLSEVRKSTLETQLDNNFADWRTYEQPMMAKLKEHPTLVNDVGELYRMSVPPEVLESRATQKALEKLKKSAEVQPSGGSQTTRPAPVQTATSGDFGDAVNLAKRQLAEQGITGPWSPASK